MTEKTLKKIPIRTEITVLPADKPRKNIWPPIHYTDLMICPECLGALGFPITCEDCGWTTNGYRSPWPAPEGTLWVTNGDVA